MLCIVCNFSKNSSHFPCSVPSARAAPKTLETYKFPHNQLLFACLHCLADKRTGLMQDALSAGTITMDTHEELFYEVNEWEMEKSSMLADVCCNKSGNNEDESITVSLLAQHRKININTSTTVKSVKIELGKLIGRQPQSIRLLFRGQDVKVKNGNTLSLLSQYQIKSGDRLDALLPLSQYAGQSRIAGLAVDGDGNACGAEANLGQNGGYAGMKILSLDLYGQCSGNMKAPLNAMGFEVDIRIKTIPPAQELRQLLENVHQLWIISDNVRGFDTQSLEIIHQFNQRGGALYLWGDNEPYYVAANCVLAKILPGVQLHGNYYACNYLGPMNNKMGPGFIQHQIFTGIVNLYEGETIARFVGSHPRIQYIMNSSESQPALGICDSHDGGGRIAIDVGFTRLFCKWDAAGTARFVGNIAAWLCSPDVDWM